MPYKIPERCILGGQTFEKGTVQEIILTGLPPVKLTRRGSRISGESTQHKGVIPDITPICIAAHDIGETASMAPCPDTVRPVDAELITYSSSHTRTKITPRRPDIT